MKKQEIIEMANKVVTDDVFTSFVATFEYNDMIIVSILCAWLQNTYDDTFWVVEKIVHERMQDSPTAYILKYKGIESVVGSLYKNISERNYDCLMFAINRITLLQGGIRNTFDNYMQSPMHKCKYAHDAFALMFGSNTCFPNINNKGTFFRYNLILYLLVFKFKMWRDIDNDFLLLPCNDYLFETACKFGITKNVMKSTLTNTIKLTDIAKQWFGKKDFWKMYEFLTFYKVVNDG